MGCNYLNSRFDFVVNEETSDIICIICKKDRTDSDNDIVLCDSCNVGESNIDIIDYMLYISSVIMEFNILPHHAWLYPIQ